jgi:hypothetical protein
MIIGGSESLGPAWTQDATIEPPAGEKDMHDGYTIAVYTPEQQARLGVDESGAILADDEDHTTAEVDDGEKEVITNWQAEEAAQEDAVDGPCHALPETSMVIAEWNPQCDEAARFLPLQCGRSGNCWCVDEAGEDIDQLTGLLGDGDIQQLDEATCLAARAASPAPVPGSDDDDGAASCPARVRRARRALNSAIDQTTHAIDELKRGVGVLWSAVEEAIRNLAAAESDLSAKAAAVKVAREAERGALLLSEAANQAWETMVDACQDETDPTAEPCRTDLLHAGSERDEADVKLSDAQGNTLDARAEEQAALDAVRAARGSLDVATRTQQAELKRLQDAVDSAAATEASKFGRYLPIVRRCQPSAKSLAAVTAQHAELVEAVLSQHVSIGAVDTLAAVDCVSSAPVAANFTAAAAVAAGEEEEGDDAFDAEHWGGSCRRMISRASRQLHASLFAVKVALDSLQSAALKLQQGVEEAKVAVDSAWVTLEGAIGEEAAKDDLAASAFAEYQEARSTWQQLKVSCGADDPACRTELLTAFDNYKHTGVLNSYAAQDLAAATAAREAAQQSFDLAKAALEATKATQLRELTRLQRSVSDEIVAEQGASCNYQYIVHRCNQFADDAVDAIDTAASADDDDDAAAGHSELAFLLTSLTTYAGMVDSLVPAPAPPPPAPAPAPTPATDSQATGGDGNHAGDDHEVNEVTTEVAPSEETTTTTTADGVAVGPLDHPAAAVAMCNPSLTEPVQMCPGGGPCPDCGEEACPCPPPPPPVA